VAADEHSSAVTTLQKSGAAFAFIVGRLGYYRLGSLMLQDAEFFSFLREIRADSSRRRARGRHNEVMTRISLKEKKIYVT
jgi:hypothetical protein